MKIIFFLLSSFLCINSIAQKQTDYKIVKTFHVQSPGGWDYISVNKNKIYLSHSSQVNILNQDNGDSLGVIANTTGVHGIAFDNALNRGYTSNGRLNNVSVFDLKTNEIITQIATAENPDAIIFEPFSKTIITCNGRGKNLSVIDPEKNIVIATIDVGGKPEAAVADGEGKLFVNVEDKNEIVEVNTKNYSVTHHWSLGTGQSPTGLDYDKKTKRLFAGCEKLLVIMDASSGSVVDSLKIGNGCDGVAFDNKRKLIFTSNGEGTMSVIKEVSASKFVSMGDYTTKRGARTIAIDEEKGEVYMPTADFEAASTPNGRPKMIPGTFQVIVVKQ